MPLARARIVGFADVELFNVELQISPPHHLTISPSHHLTTSTYHTHH
ncbi:MAG: hypothetical protein MR703_05100 [Prevotella sp.]|nr:hypothetical protein [Prevotella sp.]MDY4664632.1 hypothetical protein [Prevotella sp.]MDY4804738.1 hypothetical protein [Prevotella sp.]